MKTARRALVRAAASLALLALAACNTVPQLQHHQLSLLDKGITPAQSVERLRLQPLSVHSVGVGVRSFEIHRYLLNSGMNVDAYYLAFDNQQLLFWGYLSEFRRQGDRDLNLALNQVVGAPVPPR
jgi:hypothetical protein